jgi:hypothetical protein
VCIELPRHDKRSKGAVGSGPSGEDRQTAVDFHPRSEGRFLVTGRDWAGRNELESPTRLPRTLLARANEAGDRQRAEIQARGQIARQGDPADGAGAVRGPPPSEAQRITPPPGTRHPGPFVSLAFGGDACIRHYAVRLGLTRARVSPWRYGLFLEDGAAAAAAQR